MKLGDVLFAGAVVAILVAERRWTRRNKKKRFHAKAQRKDGAKEERRSARSASRSSSSSRLGSCAPLRETLPSPVGRLTRNVTLGIMAMAVIEAVERPMVERLTARFGKPGFARQVAAFLALDYSMHLWHVATHRVPALWRLHRVHHIDPALDASTALRFHMLDMVVSLPLRAAQASLTGATPATFALWQRFFFVSVLFHHSDVRLPPALERRLALLLTTPSMHDIHHSAVRDRTDSNWSSGLSVWDRLHGSLRLDLDSAIPIGVPAYAPGEAAIESSIRLPFQPRRDDWSPA